MKQILYIAAALLFFACSKDDMAEPEEIKAPRYLLDSLFVRTDSGFTYNPYRTEEIMVFNQAHQYHTVVDTIIENQESYLISQFSITADQVTFTTVNGQKTYQIKHLGGLWQKWVGDDEYYIVRAGVLKVLKHPTVYGITSINNSPVQQKIVVYNTVTSSGYHHLEAGRANKVSRILVGNEVIINYKPNHNENLSRQVISDGNETWTVKGRNEVWKIAKGNL